MSLRPDRTMLAPGLEISRVITGLWQVADMERDGRLLDRDAAAAAMADYARDGFDTFDMADHYGSAELITGRFLSLQAATEEQRAAAFTKWCPTPGPMTPDVVGAGIEERLERLGVPSVDLLQFHWWMFEHPGYIDAMKELVALQREGRIRHLGLTNFDTDHLRLLVKHGFPIVSNQVSFSLLDRRAAENMSAFCLANGVRLLAYGTLGGGFLTDRWVGAPEPTSVADWSKSKYKRFIDTIGGWSALQTILAALHEIARKHLVSVANVATRWVLEQPAVAAVIVGARLGEREHRADNAALFSFALDEDDKQRIDDALGSTRRIPGDCGDEYRRPPFLTASGDLSHHLESFPPVFEAVPVDDRPDRLRIDSGSVWEPICGYSRAVRIRDRILVSGTTATHGTGEVICPGDAEGQTVYILDKIAASIASLGGTLADTVCTRVYLSNADDWEPVSRVHGRYFGTIRPANTLLEVSRLVGEYAVEIEAEAVVG
ncbi:aldo/keto reductase [Microvirga subterranea]|uniref:Aryl-alcohol dehydrogenase-like predicted oxidoreductase n=1 Tax=Microvirga subterranea TaxID=186651 RepID=A0A370HJN5_9HYPH|nr:aldo/keto reductase [Microvirga subterranea]RDI57990.1 aryl-alcohol dehydrogenase-like predicted oxidoreductase [Microvirga subterranea]